MTTGCAPLPTGRCSTVMRSTPCCDSTIVSSPAFAAPVQSANAASHLRCRRRDAMATLYIGRANHPAPRCRDGGQRARETEENRGSRRPLVAPLRAAETAAMPHADFVHLRVHTAYSLA